MTKYFKCKYCVNKSTVEVAHFNILDNFLDDLTMPTLKVVSSELLKGNLDIDESNCPNCNDFLLVPSLLQKFDTNIAIFLEGASSVTVDNYTIITGGFIMDPQTGEFQASKSMNLVNFVKDGFLKGFKVDQVGQIVQQRYFHSTFYNQRTKKVFIMGGIEIKPSGELKWVSSVEFMNFDLKDKNKSKYTWITEKVGPIKRARSNFNGFSSNEYIYLYGGVCGVDAHENSLERYNCETLTGESIHFEKPNGFLYPAYGLCLQNKADEFYIIGLFYYLARA